MNKIYDRGMTELEFVRGMGRGWNLGNSLDCYGLSDCFAASGKSSSEAKPADYEVFWGNPPAGRELFAAVKAAGFGTVRIPVTWYEHLDQEGIVDPAWMDRVALAVDDALSQGLYVILDLHHENWMIPIEENREAVQQRLVSIWRQIALRFQDRGDRLLFECMNEPRLIGTPEEWGPGTAETWDIINEWNQAFVDIVRSCGGENEGRYLVLPTYGDSIRKEALGGFALPRGKRLIVTVHAYVPPGFTMTEKAEDDGVVSGGDMEHWTAEGDGAAEIDYFMKQLRQRFVEEGIPVIIGEFGARDRDNETARADWARYFVRAADLNGIMCIWWDDGAGKSPGAGASPGVWDNSGAGAISGAGDSADAGDNSGAGASPDVGASPGAGASPNAGDSFALLDRHTLKWKYPKILRAITEDEGDHDK